MYKQTDERNSHTDSILINILQASAVAVSAWPRNDPGHMNWASISNSYQNQQKCCLQVLFLDISSKTADAAMKLHDGENTETT